MCSDLFSSSPSATWKHSHLEPCPDLGAWFSVVFYLEEFLECLEGNLSAQFQTIHSADPALIL